MQNKKRLIYAEDLFTPVDFTVLRMGRSGSGKTMAMYEKIFRKRVEMAPTVDAVEVVHGRWIPLEADGYADGSPVWDLWECSECREEHSGDEDTLTPYCPNCGAKMDGGNDNA